MTTTHPVQRAGSDRVVVIPCSGQKKTEPAPAGELYLGGYHRACRATADALTANGGTVLVLSARYGLATLDRVLEPYDVTFGDRDAVGSLLLEAQARKLGIDRARDVTVLAGAAYVDAARAVWPYASAPLAGLGIGRQRQRLAELRDRAARLRTAQPVEVEFTDEPMYRLPYDYRQMPRPFTVTIAGPERHDGESPKTFVVEGYSTEKAWAKALAWYMLDCETVDAHVIAAESFEGIPAAGSGFWTDLRPEHARREALDDLADQATEAVSRFHAETGHLLDAAGDVASERKGEYEKAFDHASCSAWPLVLELADNDGRD
jgi:hypothetical protein